MIKGLQNVPYMQRCWLSRSRGSGPKLRGSALKYRQGHFDGTGLESFMHAQGWTFGGGGGGMSILERRCPQTGADAGFSQPQWAPEPEVTQEHPREEKVTDSGRPQRVGTGQGPRFREAARRANRRR